MTQCSDSHPRKNSLERRYKLEEASLKDYLQCTAMIAHGRGETFDYLLGEKTIPIANGNYTSCNYAKICRKANYQC